MKLCISNIAWDTAEDDIVGEFLRAQDISAVEIAPTKYWPAPCAPSSEQMLQVRDAWRRRGQEIVAMQSVLYGCEEMSIFGDESTKRDTIAYLETIVRIAEGLGARVLVFGSPRNRDRGERSHEQAIEEAANFFRPLAASAANAGVVIGFEPNPEHYRCNFCRTASEAMQLVEAVDHAGFGLHLDTGIAYINGEDFGASIELVRSRLVHVHISEPELAAIGTDMVSHIDNATALTLAGWQGFVSIEMRGGENNFDRVRGSVALAKNTYLAPALG